jgi:hypothetical protein
MSAARSSKATRRAAQVVYVNARTLIPSPENATLYRSRTTKDADFRRLVESVRKEGVQAPLLVSRDGYVISGHQRLAAAIKTLRFEVPVIYLGVRRGDHTADEWLAILREHNTGREKTFDELVRERLVDIDPEEAVAQVIDDRVERSRARVDTIDISGREMKRYGISDAKQEMVQAVIDVLEDLADYLPVSLRAVHYRLLVKTFFRNSKARTPYRNDIASYKDLSDLVTRMRVQRVIGWDCICDETRPVDTWRCWRNAADFIGDQCNEFLTGYARDLLQSQAQHIEVVVEKLTVRNFITPVAMRYCMPVVIMRGNSGIDARYQIVERFKASGKGGLFLLCLGDCDPDGDSIVESTLCSLRDDFGVGNVRGTRVAMTHAQADELNLPKTLEAKSDSKNYRAFVNKHDRTDCYELEAVAVGQLQRWTDDAIKGVIDVEAYNREVEEQAREAAEIMARRRAILGVMRKGTPDWSGVAVRSRHPPGRGGPRCL